MDSMRFGIRAKIFVGYAIIISFLAIFLVIVNGQLSSMQNEMNTVIDHDIQVHDLTNQIEKSLLDMETGQRGFIITGDEAYLVSYNDGRSRWQQDYSSLNALVSDNPKQMERLDAIRDAMERWIQTAGEPTISDKKAGNQAAITEFFKSDPGKKIVDSVRKQFNTFREIEKSLTDERAKQLANRTHFLKIGLYAMLILLIGLSTIVAMIISGAIVRTIKEVVRSIKDIVASKGEITQRIEVTTRDEIKDLSDATNALLDSHDQKNWMQSQLTEVVGMHQGIDDLELLGQSFLNKIASLMDAYSGALYIRSVDGKEKRMNRLAGFASSGLDASAQSFKLGEGLVGQCALEKRMLHIHNVPPRYLAVSSGLGTSDPQSLLIAPVKFEDEVIAVIELGTFGAFTPIQLELFKRIVESFGGTLYSAESRVEIERLLRESQSMMEELQLQQEELRSSNETLEEYADQLKQSSQYKSEFLANMSHELRTPLNSMLILSQMLAENQLSHLSEDEEEYARVIHASGQDLLRLINDILDLSKVEAGKLEVQAEVLDTMEMPAMLQYQFKPVAEQKGLEFHIIRDADVPAMIYTDTQRLFQILKNLLSNAFKFTHEGSVTMQIKSYSNRMDVMGTEEKIGIAISITDTGIGIPEDKQELIFEAFHQADGTTNRKYGGTGLGLSISREMAKLLGGHVIVQSKVDQGTTFTVYIPSMTPFQGMDIKGHGPEVAASTAERSVEKIGTENNARLKGKRILVVDDDIRNVFAMTNALEKEGLEVFAALDGQECLDMLEREPAFDLIFMDIMMPVMDGYEAIRTIRSNSAFANIPIITLTAKAMKQDRELCLEAGANDYISKPFDLNQMYSLLRVWLSK